MHGKAWALTEMSPHSAGMPWRLPEEGCARGSCGAHRDVTAHAVLAAGDEVVAEVELVIGMPEDGGVPGQRLPLVEAHPCTGRS